MLGRLTACLLLVACAGAEAPAVAPAAPSCENGGPGCPCAACDDGDPCTHDLCLPDGTCGATAAAGCGCVATCGDTTQLDPVQALRQHEGGVTGLQGLQGLAVTRDGRHGYVAARTSGAVTQLTRDAAGLSRTASWPMSGVTSVALAADESALWVGSDDGLWRLARDDASGALGTPSRVVDGAARAIAATDTWVALSDGQAVRVLRPDGALVGEDAAGVRGVLSLVAAPDGGALYGAAFDDDALVAWRVGDGLERLPDVTGLDGPSTLALSPDGAQLYATGFCDVRLALLDVDPTTRAAAWRWGSPGDGTHCFDASRDWEERARLGQGRIARPVAVAVRPDGAVLVHELELQTRLRTYAATPDALEERAGDGPPEPWLPPATAFLGGGWDGFTPTDDPSRRGLVRLAVAENGAVWVASGLTDGVTIVDGAQALGPVYGGAGGVDSLLGAYTLDLSPDGRTLYVAPRGLATVAVFRVDAATGGLTQLPSPQLPGLEGRGDAAVGHVDALPGDRVVLATETGDDQLHTFERDPATGLLTHRGATPLPGCAGQGGAFPADVLASPDGRDAYVTDFQVNGDSCIYHAPIGSPAVAQTLAAPALSGIETLLFDSSGRDLYAACVLSKSVAHAVRDPETGALTLAAGVTHEALYGAEMMAMAPSGRAVWVSSPISDRLVTLARSPDTGDLAVVDVLSASPQLPIDGAAGLVVSPDGQRLYVSARDSAAVTVFRVAVDGRVALERSVTWPGVLDFANGIRLSADGRTLYTAAVVSSAVGVFRVGPAFGGGCPLCP